MENKLNISKDVFNSEMFKMNFGHIHEYKPTIESLEIEKVIEASNYDMISVRINSKDLDAMYNFQRAGFYVVDCLVTYEFDVNKSIKPSEVFTVGFKDELTNYDKEKLAIIASSVFKIDRFHSDPNLKKELSDNYYYQWVKNSFKGYADGIVTAELSGDVVGFITYKINDVDDSTSTIVLNAVDPNHMGKKVYENMLKKAMIDILKSSTKIRIGTQVDNIPVQRSWQKFGYKLIDVKYILHRYNQ